MARRSVCFSLARVSAALLAPVPGSRGSWHWAPASTASPRTRTASCGRVLVVQVVEPELHADLRVGRVQLGRGVPERREPRRTAPQHEAHGGASQRAVLSGSLVSISVVDGESGFEIALRSRTRRPHSWGPSTPVAQAHRKQRPWRRARRTDLAEAPLRRPLPLAAPACPTRDPLLSRGLKKGAVATLGRCPLLALVGP